MKTKALLLSVFIFLALNITIKAQAPQAFKYQAIARYSDGSIISNEAVDIRISIINGNNSQ